MRRLLVLRPEPGASATVERARERGLDASVIPLFEIEPVEWGAPDPGAFDALLLTSANAVRFGGAGLASVRGLPVYAVGEATAEAARAAGFAIAGTGEVGVDRLLSSIAVELRLLHLCGADRRSPETARQAIAPIVVYRARAIDNPDLSAAPGSVAVVHSPRAGARLAELLDERSAIFIAAISAPAAAALGEGWGALEIADRPSDESLLALAARLCNRSAQQ
jgi:uroporphyrinogen-III synthase